MALKLSVAGLKWANFSKMLVKTFKLFLIFNLVKVDCFETENWLNNVKSLKTKCVQSFKDENFAKQNEEILKFASCEESWAKWSYKYKNANAGSKLKDVWTGYVTLKISNKESSNMRDGLKSKKCLDLRNFQDIEEIQGNVVNHKFEGIVIITFADGGTQLGHAKNNHFEGIIRNFNNHGSLERVTRADSGFVIWSGERPDYIFIQSKTNKAESFVLKSNKEIMNCKQVDVFGSWCRELQPENLDLIHFEECLVTIDPEPESLSLDTEGWKKLSSKFESFPTISCGQNENWNGENIKESVLKWIQDLSHDDFWSWFKESSPEPFDPAKPRLEVTLPFLVGRSRFTEIKIKSQNRILLTTQIIDGRISVDVPDEIAKLEEWTYPVFFQFSSKQNSNQGVFNFLEKYYFLIGRLRHGQLHGLVFSHGAFTSDHRGICSNNIFENTGFIARYDKGLAVGKAWKGLMGGAWIHGTIDKDGNFNGNDVAFIYPDFKVAFRGIFKNNLMVEGRAVSVVGEKCDEFGMKELKYSEPSGPTFHYKPPTAEDLGDQPLIVDPLDDHYVEIHLNSSILGSGEGLFAKVDIPKGTIYAIISGYVIKEGDLNKLESEFDQLIKEGLKREDPRVLALSMYRIGLKTCQVTIDLPGEYKDVSKFNLARGHKINHSFNPNSVFAEIESPRLGPIRCLISTEDIKAGQELFANYYYVFSRSPKWFKELVLNKMRSDPNFFNAHPLVTQGKSLDQLEREYKDYLVENEIEE